MKYKKLTASETSSVKAKKYPNGRKPPIDPKRSTGGRKVVITNKEEYDKRSRAYQDSLSLSQHPVFGTASVYDIPKNITDGPASRTHLSRSGEYFDEAKINSKATQSLYRELGSMPASKFKMLRKEGSTDYYDSSLSNKALQDFLLEKSKDFATPGMYTYNSKSRVVDWNDRPNHRMIAQGDARHVEIKKMIPPSVEPVLGASKAEVSPKNLRLSDKPKGGNVQKTLPRQINKIQQDASGANVYVTINGKTSVIPKKEYPLWRAANKDLYESYLRGQKNSKK